MFEIEQKDVKKYEGDLKRFAASAYPFATKETLNRAARNTAKVAGDFVRGKMILRNNWTLRSIRYERAHGSVVSRQQSRTGSVQEYMATQEFGGVKRARGARGVPIPTPASSGETALPRRKPPRRANSLASISLRKASTAAASRKQRNRIAIAQAAEGKGGARFVFLDFGRRSGIFRVTGGKRRPRLVKVWAMGRPSVVIPKRPWLLPATRKVEAQMPSYYATALVAQLRRHKVFGY